MRALLLSLTILFLIAVPTFAEDTSFERVKEVELKVPFTFTKGQEVRIKPVFPLPVYGKNTSLCFVVNDAMPVEYNTIKFKKSISKEFEKFFSSKEKEDPYLPGKPFLEGAVSSSENTRNNFINQRFPRWEFLPKMTVFEKNKKTGDIEPVKEYGRLSVCAMISKSLKDVEEIVVTPLKSFAPKSSYWLTADM